MAHAPRVTKAEAEQILGRPCPHEHALGLDYCRSCANNVAARRLTAKQRVGMEQYYQQPKVSS